MENNRDQLEPRKVPIQPSGWLTRLVVGYEEPPPKIKLPAPKQDSLRRQQLTTAVIERFRGGCRKQTGDFVREWGEADLGDLQVKDPLFPLHLTADTELLIIVRAQPAAPVAGGKCEEECGISGLSIVAPATNRSYRRGREVYAD